MTARDPRDVVRAWSPHLGQRDFSPFARVRDEASPAVRHRRPPILRAAHAVPVGRL